MIKSFDKTFLQLIVWVSMVIYFLNGKYVKFIYLNEQFFKNCTNQFFENNKKKTWVVMLNDLHDSFFNVASKVSEFYLQQTEK